MKMNIRKKRGEILEKQSAHILAFLKSTPFLNGHDKIRFQLLEDNFVLSEVLKEFKRKIKGKTTLYELVNEYGSFITTGFNDNNDDFFLSDYAEKLQKVGELTNVDWGSLLFFMLGEKLYDSIYRNIKIIEFPGLTVQLPGIYARYHPSMNKQDWDSLWLLSSTWARKQLKHIYPEISDKDYEKVKQRHQTGSSEEKENIAKYLQVEKVLAKCLKEKKDYPVDTGAKPSGYSIVEAAIESALWGMDLSESKIDSLKPEYRDNYYHISRKYRLPTYRNLPRFLKILK